VLVGRLRGKRIVGVDAAEERIGRVGGELLDHVGGGQHRVLVEHVAGRARAAVGVRKRRVEELLTVWRRVVPALRERLGYAEWTCFFRVGEAPAGARRQQGEGRPEPLDAREPSTD
jgi:hypothetical protein